MTFTPGAALAFATRNALETFARHKPTIFKLARENSDAGKAFVAEYARALIGVTLDAIPEAAQRWVATKTEIPGAASFGMFARAIDVAEYRSTAPLEQSLFAQNARRSTETTEHLKDGPRIDALGARAFEALGTWTLVAETWSLLMETAPNAEQRADVRFGRVPDDVFDDAIAAVRRGKRAGAGPMKSQIAI